MIPPPRRTRGRAKRAARAKVRNAPVITRRAGRSPAEVTRVGPSRPAVSAPLTWSIASLKKLVAIWMRTALARTRAETNGSNALIEMAKAHPATTGISAAPKVRGRAARIQGFICSDGTRIGSEGQFFCGEGIDRRGRGGHRGGDEKETTVAEGIVATDTIAIGGECLRRGADGDGVFRVGRRLDSLAGGAGVAPAGL